jgi:hypothetical protein
MTLIENSQKTAVKNGKITSFFHSFSHRVMTTNIQTPNDFRLIAGKASDAHTDNLSLLQLAVFGAAAILRDEVGFNQDVRANVANALDKVMINYEKSVTALETALSDEVGAWQQCLTNLHDNSVSFPDARRLWEMQHKESNTGTAQSTNH